MDVIYYLAKTLDRLARGLTWLLFAAIGFAFGHLKKAALNKAQRSPVNQGGKVPASQPKPYTTPQPTPQPQAMPEVHVHVHVDGNRAEARPELAVQPLPQPSQHAPAGILNRPDHGIYITTGSHLMLEHPRAEDLLEQLDKMLFVAAHRDGDPFTVSPPLDASKALRGEGVALPPLSPIDESEFIDGRRIELPAPDGKVWMLTAGKEPQPLATGTPS